MRLFALALLSAALAPAQQNQAYVTAAQGQVSVVRDDTPWAVSPGEHVSTQHLITTGQDGFAHFDVKGGSSFELYANSRVVFRQNAANAGDLVDIQSGRVRVHLNPGPGQWQQRVFTPVAVISSGMPSTIAVAIDENDAVRVDVLEGEVQIRHALHPNTDATTVKAVDALLIYKDQRISRQLDRGRLYQCTIKPLLDLFHFGAKPEEQQVDHHLLIARFRRYNEGE